MRKQLLSTAICYTVFISSSNTVGVTKRENILLYSWYSKVAEARRWERNPISNNIIFNKTVGRTRRKKIMPVYYYILPTHVYIIIITVYISTYTLWLASWRKDFFSDDLPRETDFRRRVTRQYYYDALRYNTACVNSFYRFFVWNFITSSSTRT